MTVKAYALGNAKGGRFTDVVQKHSPGKRTRRAPHALEHQQNMFPDVAFGVKFRRLLYALTSLHLRENVVKQSRTVQQLEAVSCASFGQDTHQLFSDPFRGDLGNLGSEPLHALQRFFMNGKL